MSAFYGTVVGMAETPATRRGGRDIKVAAQSWNGSVITKMKYSKEGELMVELQIAEDSSTSGYTFFRGTIDELKKRLEDKEEGGAA